MTQLSDRRCELCLSRGVSFIVVSGVWQSRKLAGVHRGV